MNRLVGASASSPPSATTNFLRSSESQSEQSDRQEHKAEIRKTKTKYGGGCFVKLMLKMAKLQSHLGLLRDETVKEWGAVSVEVFPMD